MTTPTVGAMFAGYGGLELALNDTLGTDLAWVADNGAAPSRILAHNHPDTPNLGDVTRIRWGDVEPVDVLAGGFPCQDLSNAGLGAGLRPGTRSGLWVHMAYAIDALKPRLVVIENVLGLTWAEAHCEVEPCPWCVGDGTTSPMRALGAVLGDLAELGFDAWWYCLRASDVGAAHARARVFILAHPADPNRPRLQGRERRARETGAPTARGDSRAHNGRAVPTPVTLLPTPAVNDMGAGKTLEWWDEWAPRQQSADGRPAPHGRSLDVEARRLLPTPRTSDGWGAAQHGDGGPDLRTAVRDSWGDYGPAIHRAEALAGWPAPPPTEVGPQGNTRLSARFVEWLMCLPQGWVTGTPGLSRQQQLEALGNGVVPPQASAAIRAYLDEEPCATNSPSTSTSLTPTSPVPT